MDSAHIEEKQMDIAQLLFKLYNWFSDRASNHLERPSDVKYTLYGAQ